MAEDNPANQKFVDYVLRGRGHEVEIAAEGEEAVYLSGEDHYDVILMDVQMPGMSGLEATAAIRRQEGDGRRVPIIAMTAFAMPSDRERCLAAGMDGYLSKPVNPQQMLDLVESLGGGTEACVAAPPAALETAEPPTEPSPVFDPVLALTRCFDSQRMVAQMIECFYRDVDRLLAQMRAALQQGDLTEVGRLGHHIKGTVVYLGARTTAEAAIQVERFIVSSGTADEARRAVDALEHECIALKAALRRYAKGVAKAP